MRRILFVDDEARILDGLRRMLRPRRDRWEMRFVQSGALAVAALTEAPADVVVTDMRMPQMDGAALLDIVATRWPETIRIFLSGQTDEAAAARAVRVAHQFLMKPCDDAILWDVVERTCALQGLMREPDLRRLVGAIGNLPAAPSTFTALGTALANPDTGIRDIAAIILRDGGLSAKVLQLVNSSFFGQGRRVSSIDQAAVLLGTGLIRSLALVYEVFAPGAAGPVAAMMEAEQTHAIGVAELARQIAADRALDEAVVTAGLLHDIGRLILAGQRIGEVLEDRRRAEAEGCPLVDVEFERYGVTHAELGAYLLGLWGLPGQVVEAVAHHHRPDRLEGNDLRILGAVHVADALVHEVTDRTGGTLDLAFVERLGWTDRLEEWRGLATQVTAGAGAT
jgi:putative nucleotidyltransferase with HDIG domain